MYGASRIYVVVPFGFWSGRTFGVSPINKSESTGKSINECLARQTFTISATRDIRWWKQLDNFLNYIRKSNVHSGNRIPGCERRKGACKVPLSAIPHPKQKLQSDEYSSSNIFPSPNFTPSIRVMKINDERTTYKKCWPKSVNKVTSNLSIQVPWKYTRLEEWHSKNNTRISRDRFPSSSTLSLIAAT